MRVKVLKGDTMKLRLLAVALIAVLGTGCATTDKSGLAGYKIKPDSTVRHGAPDAQSFYQLARFYHGQKRYEKAEMAYIKAIALDGGRVDSYNALGSLYAERGDLERAIQQFELAAGIDPKSAYVQNNLGYAYFLQGRYDEAYQAVRRGLALDPKMKRGWANVELIAKAQPSPNTTLADAAKAQQLATLPPSLVAPAEPATIQSPEPQEPVMAVASATPAQEVPAATVDVSPSMATEPAVEAVAVKEGGGVSVVAAQRPEAVVQVAVSSETHELSPASTEKKSGESLDDGKFVLVSTGREVVNLSAPEVTAKLAPAPVAAPAAPEPVPEPVALVAPPVAATPAASPVIGPGLAVDLAGVDFEVTNANGVTGFAKKFSALLRNDNIVVSRITNHTSFKFAETVIEYQPGFANAAQALMARTKLDVSLVPAKAPRTNSDVRIFLGRDAVEAVDSLRTNLAGKGSSKS